MENIVREHLHPSCSGGVCCEHPCGPVYRHQSAEAETVLPKEQEVKEAEKLGRLRSLGRRIMASLA